ncbi:MAG: phosphatidate cytidylyltransferase [Clostridia bacterium]|nr:phosphatidate cytidylyltransferase [Clostridia bacterium]
MKTRIIFFFVLAAVFIPVLYFCETPVMPVFLALMGGVAAFEDMRCVGIHRKIPLTVVAVVFCSAFPLLIRFFGAGVFLNAAPAAAAVFLLIFLSASMFSKGGIRLADALEAAAVAIYIAFGFASAVLVCDMSGTGRWIFYIIFITSWVTDTGAYVFGKLFGKHKLIPEVSPKKTVEGAVGGIVANVAILSLYGFILWKAGISEFRPLIIIPVAAVASVFSQIGDLVMSNFKREHGIKDFGRIFPGHGGVLDRFDSVLATAAVIAAAECFLNLLPSIEEVVS